MEILLALAYIFLVGLVFFEYCWLSRNLFKGMVVLRLFQALFETEEAGLLHDNQMMRMKEVRAWFNDKLDWPHRLSRFSKPHAFN